MPQFPHLYHGVDNEITTRMKCFLSSEAFSKCLAHGVHPVHDMSCWDSRQLQPGAAPCAGCLVFLIQGLNVYLLPWHTDSLPLSHHGSPPISWLIPGVSLPRNRESWVTQPSLFRPQSSVRSPQLCDAAWRHETSIFLPGRPLSIVPPGKSLPRGFYQSETLVPMHIDV